MVKLKLGKVERKVLGYLNGRSADDGTTDGIRKKIGWHYGDYFRFYRILGGMVNDGLVAREEFGAPPLYCYAITSKGRKALGA